MKRVFNDLIISTDLSDVNKANMYIGRVQYLYDCFCKYKLKTVKYASHSDSIYRDEVPALHNFLLKFEHNISFDIELHTYVIYDAQLARINGSDSPVIYCDKKDLDFYKNNPDFLELHENVMNLLWSIKTK